jgi:hypothetical protein
MDRMRRSQWVVLCAAVALASAIGFTAIHGQQRKAALTPQDYIDIQQLVAKYPYTLDGGLEHGKAFADLFTDDGEFHQQTGRVWRGRAELLTIAAKAQETPNALGHFIMNHVIEPTAEGAIGKEYLITISSFGEEQNGRTASTVTPYHYEDVYVKTPAGWRFKSRTVVDRDPSTGRGNNGRRGQRADAPSKEGR